MRILKKMVMLSTAVCMATAAVACKNSSKNFVNNNGGNGGADINMGSNITTDTILSQGDWNTAWKATLENTNLKLQWAQVGTDRDKEELCEFEAHGFICVADGKEYSEEHIVEKINGVVCEDGETGSNLCYYGVIDGVGYEWIWSEEKNLWMWAGGWTDPIGTGESAVYDVLREARNYEAWYVDVEYNATKGAYVLTKTEENEFRSQTATYEFKFQEGKLSAGKIIESISYAGGSVRNETWAFTIVYGGITVGKLPPLDPAGKYR